MKTSALLATVCGFGLTACSLQPTGIDSAAASPWPAAKSEGLVDSDTEARIDALLARMSLEEKIGQMIQADIGAITPEDLREYPLGSILAGGSSPPLGHPDRSPAQPWIDSSRAFNAVALEERDGHVPVPLMFGIDAVHGNSNVVGATIFPHNVGLGAMRDPELMREIGRVTAIETAAAGFDWAFGPTLAVPQDGRWGRAYEGYSEDPALVAAYAAPMVEGLQGKVGDWGIQQGRVSASLKHFLGDGGTTDGIDQGNTEVDEETLVRVHNAGYPPAIEAGAMTVMASFNSWNGKKMHGNRELLTDALKGRMGFDGFVVGDWNGHGQIPGCTNTDCPQTFLAGLDMAMAPDSWKALYESTLSAARDGTIPMSRIDDAVRRILRVKFKLGLFDASRPYEQRAGLIGSAEHRAIAREAVRKSLVLLKNDGVLPLRPSARILVAGDAADDIGRQSGGWTLSWQGDGNTNADFPGATSIYRGIADAAASGGGEAILSEDGNHAQKPDVAIVVFGELPYAEMRGDVRTLEFQPGDKQALALLKRLQADGIPTVSVFLSGRPMWVNPELNASNAFVAAWFPGSEGAGIADLLIGGTRDFTGSLSFSWPRTAGQFVLDRSRDGYDPLFPFGFGLTYAEDGSLDRLSEISGVDASLANTSIYFTRGRVPAPFELALSGGVTRSAVDSDTAQEGAMKLQWSGPGSARIMGPDIALTRETNADMNVQITYRLEQGAAAKVAIGLGDARLDLSPALSGEQGWHRLRIPLKCLREGGADMSAVSQVFSLTADQPFAISISDIRLATDPAGTVCPATLP